MRPPRPCPSWRRARSSSRSAGLSSRPGRQALDDRDQARAVRLTGGREAKRHGAHTLLAQGADAGLGGGALEGLVVVAGPRAWFGAQGLNALTPMVRRATGRSRSRRSAAVGVEVVEDLVELPDVRQSSKSWSSSPSSSVSPSTSPSVRSSAVVGALVEVRRSTGCRTAPSRSPARATAAVLALGAEEARPTRSRWPGPRDGLEPVRPAVGVGVALVVVPGAVAVQVVDAPGRTRPGWRGRRRRSARPAPPAPRRSGSSSCRRCSRAATQRPRRRPRAASNELPVRRQARYSS